MLGQIGAWVLPHFWKTGDRLDSSTKMCVNFRIQLLFFNEIQNYNFVISFAVKPTILNSNLITCRIIVIFKFLIYLIFNLYDAISTVNYLILIAQPFNPALLAPFSRLFNIVYELILLSLLNGAINLKESKQRDSHS